MSFNIKRHIYTSVISWCAPTGPRSCHFLTYPAIHLSQTLHPSGARHTPIPNPVVPVPNSQRSLNLSLSRLSSFQLRTTRVFLLWVFVSSSFLKKTSFALFSRGRWRISQILGPLYSRNLSLLRVLTNEAERTWDLPKHGAARACPWLLMALVAGSVRRGRGGDRYSQQRT